MPTLKKGIKLKSGVKIKTTVKTKPRKLRKRGHTRMA